MQTTSSEMMIMMVFHNFLKSFMKGKKELWLKNAKICSCFAKVLYVFTIQINNNQGEPENSRQS